jgi:rhodanese-related sulfurtransferase
MGILEKLKLQIQERTEIFNMNNRAEGSPIAGSIRETIRKVVTPPGSSRGGTSLTNLRQMVVEKFQSDSIITPEQLYNLLYNTNNPKKVLVLDVRKVAEYLDGHISSSKCGVVAVDPDWLKVASNSSDLESLMTAFGPKDLGLKKVFESRGEYELVVYCDSNSCSLQNDLVQLHKIIYEWEFKVNLATHPKVLVGGYTGILYFLNKSLAGVFKREG